MHQGRQHPPGHWWITTWLVVAAPCAMLALLNLPVSVTFVVGSSAFGLAATALHLRGGVRGTAGGWGHQSVMMAARLAFVFMGLVGLLTFSVGLALVAAIALVLTSPLVVSQQPTSDSGSSTGGARGSVPKHVALDSDDFAMRLPVREHVRALSDSELCREWRRSFVVLQATTSHSQRVRVVDIRRALLDEMERRNPLAVGRWLTSGARAASGPDRYLLASPGDDEGRPRRG